MAACNSLILSQRSPFPLLQAISAWVCTFWARCANFIEEMVSQRASSANEQVTISLVRELPISDSLRILVSLDSRKGTWSDPFTRALMVLPRQLRERLIFLAYSRPSPCTLLFPTFSLPAKSTKLNLHYTFLPSESRRSMTRVKTTCEREEHSLRSVSLIFLRMFPLLMSANASASVAMGCWERLCTTQLLLPASLILSSPPPPDKRSMRFQRQIYIMEQLSFAPTGILPQISLTTEGTSPSSLPNIVQVLPLPVLPYAKMVALYPQRKELVASLAASAKTACCSVAGSKMESNLQTLRQCMTVWGECSCSRGEGRLLGRMRRQVLMFDPRDYLAGWFQLVLSVSSTSVLSCYFYNALGLPKLLQAEARGGIYSFSPILGGDGRCISIVGGGVYAFRSEAQFFIVVIMDVINLSSNCNSNQQRG